MRFANDYQNLGGSSRRFGAPLPGTARQVMSASTPGIGTLSGASLRTSDPKKWKPTHGTYSLVRCPATGLLPRPSPSRPSGPSPGSSPAGSLSHRHRYITEVIFSCGKVGIGHWCRFQREYVQGCLLDWPGIREELLARISDLLPHADLVPHNTPVEDGSRLLASLPVRLLPGALEVPEVSGLTPTHQSLIVTWASMLVGAVAVGVLLQGVIALSERRAAFVSAVTHELRTPLTTFRMYAEMLAEGMVTNEDDRRKYLNTLRVEADRLTHLVCNVLAYAKLERGGLGGRIAPVSVATILHKEGDRLADRAEQAGLELLVNADEATLAASAMADASAVEQILFNLVDNACKYGCEREAADAASGGGRGRAKRVLAGSRSWARHRAAERGRLFQPFRKSADDAAQRRRAWGWGWRFLGGWRSR